MVRDGGLAEPDRIGQIADARFFALGRGDDRDETKAGRVGNALNATAIDSASSAVIVSRVSGVQQEPATVRGSSSTFVMNATLIEY